MSRWILATKLSPNKKVPWGHVTNVWKETKTAEPWMSCDFIACVNYVDVALH